SEVVNAVSKQRNAVDTEPKRKSRIPLRVDAVPFQNRRVDEAGAAEFQPSAVFESGAGDGEVNARFHKGKEVRSEARDDVFAKHRPGEGSKCAFKLSHRD